MSPFSNWTVCNDMDSDLGLWGSWCLEDDLRTTPAWPRMGAGGWGWGPLTWTRLSRRWWGTEAVLTSLHWEDTIEAVSISAIVRNVLDLSWPIFHCQPLRFASAPEKEMLDWDCAGDMQGVLSTLPYLDTGRYFVCDQWQWPMSVSEHLGWDGGTGSLMWMTVFMLPVPFWLKSQTSCTLAPVSDIILWQKYCVMSLWDEFFRIYSQKIS